MIIIFYLLSSLFPYVVKYMCDVTCGHEINIFFHVKWNVYSKLMKIFLPKLSLWMPKYLHLYIIALHLNIAFCNNMGSSVLELPSEFMSHYFGNPQWWEIFILKDAFDF